MRTLRYISLFSGGFGLDLGIEQARSQNYKYEVALATDKLEAARETIRHNRPDVNILGDSDGEFGGDLNHIPTSLLLERAELEVGEADLVVGGPPCQTWSILGNRTGFEDDRGTLLLQFIRVVREARPRGFLLENVTGLLNQGNGAAYKQIIKLFKDAGYNSISTWQLNAVDFGVAQYRKRVFIVGFRTDLDIASNLEPPQKTHFPRPTDSDSKQSGQKYYLYVEDVLRNIPDVIENNIPRVHGERVRRRYMQLPPGSRDKVDHTDRLRWDEPSKTVLVGSTSGGGRPFIHPEYPRHLTVREAARLQDFPDQWVFQGTQTAQYRQVGNAVPPKLAQRVAMRIGETLTSSDEKNTKDEMLILSTT